MPLPLLFFFGLVFAGGACYSLLISLGIVGASNKAVRARLQGSRPVKPEKSRNPVIRIQGNKNSLINLVATSSSRAKIERNIQLAGRPDGWTVGRVVVAKVLFTTMGVLYLYIQLTGGGSPIKVIFSFALILACYFAPDVLINKRGEARQEIIQQELPDVLDQVTISIESGMGFEAAFARIGERRTGPLAEEIIRTVQDMRLGMSRRDAYQGMADRTNVDDLRKFVKAITQAEQYGVSVSTVVRTQAVEMRFKRRTRAEGKALQVPVKILFPMFVCIFPVLFIVILTPAVLNLTTTLNNSH